MKKIFFKLSVFATVLLVYSCTKPDSIDVARVTVYPTIDVTGNNPYFIPLNGTFVEPGVTALEGIQPIPFTTTGSGNYRGSTSLDLTKTDEYSLVYTAANKDGFKASGTRKVIVYKTGDLINSIEGVYTSSNKRNNVTNPAQQNLKYVYIWKNTDGTYQISDAFGGWYQYGRGFGIGYITPGGKITATNISTNSFSFQGTLANTGFGGTANITSLTVNPITKKLVLTCTWDASPTTTYVFESTLTQVQI